MDFFSGKPTRRQDGGMNTDIQYRYFSSVKGHVVQRYGTGVHVGVVRAAGGWEWDEDEVVAIPETECCKYEREYQNAVRHKALQKRSQDDYDAYVRKQEQKAKAHARELAAKQAAAEKEAKAKSSSRSKKSEKDETKGEV